MGIFSFLTNSGSGKDAGAGDASYDTEHPLLGLKDNLTYQECKDIYQYWALGKRVASAIVDFAMSAEREIYFKDLPTDFTERFNEIIKEYSINTIIKQSAVYARVFGMSAVFIACEDKDANEKLSYKDIKKGKISFNVLDPLCLSGTQVGTDPLTTDYQKVKQVVINSQIVDLSRVCVLFNALPFYLTYVPSNLTFGTPSIYQNMVGLIVSWNRCVVALERAATKAGSIIFKNRNGGALNSIINNSINQTLDLIRNMQNDGAISIEKDAQVELFNLTGVGEIDSIITQMNNIILLALSDTPGAILLDKDLANGFAEGGEQMKALLIAVDTFRDVILKNIYEFLDKYILYLALTDEFLSEMLETYKSDFKGMTTSDLRELAINNFYFEYGNLYPETEATTIDNAGRKLDNLQKLQGLGANLKDIEDVLNNNNEIFFKNIKLNEQNLDSFGDDEGGEEPSEVKESGERNKEVNNDTE